MDEAVQQLQRVNDMLWEKIVCDINNYPDWFGDVTEKELQDREIDIATKIKISNIRDHDDYNDTLRDSKYKTIVVDYLKFKSEVELNFQKMVFII